MSVCLQWFFDIRLRICRSYRCLLFLGCFKKFCNNLQNVVATTYIFVLQQPTFLVCNFLHFYFTTNSTGYLKLLFPDATEVDKVDVTLFETYCLAPAIEMRSIIKTQLGIIDPGEFGEAVVPDIRIKEEFREE